MNKKCTIFYSWQSDVKVSRNFITDCLGRLGKKMKEIGLCEIDRDTQGLAGAPDIGDSIYEKIESADIFIADVTIINKDYAGRKTPNPNVLIELGYAIKALGWDRIILLYGKDFGEIEELPFDINHRRITSFSLDASEEKSVVREYILSCILKTIQILNQEHRLYGGSAESVNAQTSLRQLIMAGLEFVWLAYVEKKSGGDGELYDKMPPVSEAQFELLEKAHDLLDEKQYQLANEILFLMKMSRIGNEDMYGWEFAEQLVPVCFEDLCVEFADKMYELPLIQVIKESVVDLLNALSVDEYIDYNEKREKAGKVILSTLVDALYACGKDGQTLCDGRMEEGGFTGYKCTDHYIGEFVENQRHGKGVEYSMSMYCVESNYVVREGIWEAGCFVEGRVNGVLVEIVKGMPEFVQGPDGDVVTSADWEFRNILLYEEEDYHYVDAQLKDGVYSIIEGSMRCVPKGESDWE